MWPSSSSSRCLANRLELPWRWPIARNAPSPARTGYPRPWWHPMATISTHDAISSSSRADVFRDPYPDRVRRPSLKVASSVLFRLPSLALLQESPQAGTGHDPRVEICSRGVDRSNQSIWTAADNDQTLSRLHAAWLWMNFSYPTISSDVAGSSLTSAPSKLEPYLKQSQASSSTISSLENCVRSASKVESSI